MGGVECYTDGAGTTPVSALNDPVNLWKDQSGNGYHLTLPASTTAPQYDPSPKFLGNTNGGTFPNQNVLSATGGVKFNGSTMGLSNASIRPCTDTNKPITWLLICCGQIGTAGAVGLENGNFMAVIPATTTDGFNTAKSSGGGVLVTNPGGMTFAPRGIVARFDPTQGTVLTKAVIHDAGRLQTASGSSLPNPGTINAGIYVGRDTVFPHFWSGTILEIAVWDSALTDAQMNDLDAYIRANYHSRNGFSHLALIGDSLARGYALNQNDNPASYGSGGNSPGLTLWNNRFTPLASFYNGGNVGYKVQSPAAPGSTQSMADTHKNYRDPWALRDVVILEGGTNDLNSGRTDAQVIADIQTYCGYITAKSFPRIVLWTIPRRGDWSLGSGPYGGVSGGTWTDAMETYRQAVNAWIKASAVSGGYCHAVYDSEVMGFTNPADGVLYSSDKLHFTDAGYKRHAANLAAFIDANSGAALLAIA